MIATASLAEGGGPPRPHRAVPGQLASRERVRVQLGEPYEREDLATFPLRWEATGARGLFPVLHGELELAALGPDRTHVALVARYDPPLGSIGRLLDEKLLHHVAEASARSFLHGLQATIEEVEVVR